MRCIMRTSQLNALLQEWSPSITFTPLVGHAQHPQRAKLQWVYCESDGRFTVLLSITDRDDWLRFSQAEPGSSAWNFHYEGKGGSSNWVFSERQPCYQIIGINTDCITT